MLSPQFRKGLDGAKARAPWRGLGATSGRNRYKKPARAIPEGDVMTMKFVFAALAIAAGVAAAMQAATNAGLSKSAGLGPALIVNTVIVLIGAVGLWAALG